MLNTSSPPFATCHATYLNECECRLLESMLFFGPLTAKVSDKPALSCGMTWCSTLITEHYANWAGATTQVRNDSFNEYMPMKKVSMQATDDRKQRARDYRLTVQEHRENMVHNLPPYLPIFDRSH